jgi:uronate dehydrogenase
MISEVHMAERVHTIVLTGAAGNLGRKLSQHWRERYRVRAIDICAKGDESVTVADLTRRDAGWSSAFAGADAVVHLAANPNPVQSWDEAQRNIQATFNVLLVAKEAEVRRVVYASSNHVMGGYKDEDRPWTLTTDLPPRPGTVWRFQGQLASSRSYALGKLCGEELGRCCAEECGMAVISVRVGWVQLGQNLPEQMPEDTDEWTRLMWLSNADLCQLFDCCLTAVPYSRCLIVNGMSANRGMRWDIESARRGLGYAPRDGVG